MTRTLMWEAKAMPGRGAELLVWVLANTDPAADVYRSADDRVVVIDDAGRDLPEPPAELLARTPHVWRFEHVPR